VEDLKKSKIFRATLSCGRHGDHPRDFLISPGRLAPVRDGQWSGRETIFSSLGRISPFPQLPGVKSFLDPSSGLAPEI
jgi:hypothetical protein